MGFLSCPLCEHVTIADLQELQQKIAKSLSRNLTCPICSSIITGLTSLHYHLATHIPIKCPVIPVVNLSSPEQIPSLERLEIGDGSRERREIRCDPTVGATQSQPASQNDPPKTIHYNCDLCGLVFSSGYFLALHKDIIHSNSNGFEVSCKLCESKFKDLEEYRTHVKEVHSERRYICDRCPKSFKMKGGLLVHTRMYHDNSSPSTCHICQRHFTSKALKELHEKRYHVNSKQNQIIEPLVNAEIEAPNPLGDAKSCLENLMNQTSQSPLSVAYMEQGTSSQLRGNSPKASNPLNKNLSAPTFPMEVSNKSSPPLTNTLTNYDVVYQNKPNNNIKESLSKSNKIQKAKSQINGKKGFQTQTAKPEEGNQRVNNIFTPETFLQLVAVCTASTSNINTGPQMTGFSNHQQTPFLQNTQNDAVVNYLGVSNNYLPQTFAGVSLENINRLESSFIPSQKGSVMPISVPDQQPSVHYLTSSSQACTTAISTHPAQAISPNKAPISAINASTVEIPNRAVNDYIISLPSNLGIGPQATASFSHTKFDGENTEVPCLTNTGSPEVKNFNEDSSNASPTKRDDGGSSTKVADNKQWECEICKKSFTTKYFLKKHKRLHTGETPYACEECGKTFVFQQSYHKHIFYHSDDKPHICPHCGRAFKEMSTLHNHIRIHTGEKPFVCATCGKAFRQRVSYFVHQRIHTGQMPYKCDACQRVFRYKVSLRSHKCSGHPMDAAPTQKLSETDPTTDQGEAGPSGADDLIIDAHQARDNIDLSQGISTTSEATLFKRINGEDKPTVFPNKDLQWFIGEPSMNTNGTNNYSETNNNLVEGSLSLSTNCQPKEVCDPKKPNDFSATYPASMAPTLIKTPQGSSPGSVNYNPSSLQMDADLDNETFLRSLFS